MPLTSGERTGASLDSSPLRSHSRRDHTGRGMISLICGCMFSGKTTELLRRLDAAAAEISVVFKHVIDVRYARDSVVSHAGKSCPAVVVDGAHAILSAVPEGATLVAVDEAHFLDGSLVDVVTLLRDRGVNVVLTALDRDSWGRPFSVIEKLSTAADERAVLTATCAMCGVKATRTCRKTPIVNGYMIGGAESYEPRCCKCWQPPVEHFA